MAGGRPSARCPSAAGEAGAPSSGRRPFDARVLPDRRGDGAACSRLRPSKRGGRGEPGATRERRPWGAVERLVVVVAAVELALDAVLPEDHLLGERHLTAEECADRLA